MRSITRMSELTLPELKALAAGELEYAVSDRDFLEILARRGCFVVSPWVVKGSRGGKLSRVTALSFDEAGNIDKVRVLVEVARALRAARRTRPDFGPRFSSES